MFNLCLLNHVLTCGKTEPESQSLRIEKPKVSKISLIWFLSKNHDYEALEPCKCILDMYNHILMSVRSVNLIMSARYASLISDYRWIYLGSKPS